MARYEFVEGNSSKFWDIQLEGSQLTVKFGKIGTAGQSQTKTFTSPELAKKEHDKLIAEKVKKGYHLAVVGSAATSASSETPKKKAAPDSSAATTSSIEHLRKDYYVYNEATGFAITSKGMGGKGIDSGTKEWDKAVRNGDLIPIELVQDDPFIIRVLVGGALTDQESEEWVGRLNWKLRVPDGNLVICGGSEYVMEEFEGEESEYMAEYVRHIKVPRGEYRATIYMYMNSVNGKSCLSSAKGGDEPDPLGEWFRRTRPNDEFPAWLHNQCVSDPDEDPGHEKEWKKAKEKDEPGLDYVDFLLHLVPLKAGEKVEMPALNDSGGGDHGWFSTPTECREPARIPLGLVAKDVEGKKEEVESVEEFQEVFKYTDDKKHPLKPVGDTVELPLDKLDRLYRVAWFCHGWSAPGLIITPPDGAKLPVIEKMIANTKFQMEGEQLFVSFSSNQRQSGFLMALAAVSQELKGLPDGTLIALDAVFPEESELKSDRPKGLHRYRGVVTKGILRVTHAYPVADATKLNAALALSAQAEKGPLIDAGSEEIAQDVFKKLKQHPYFEDNPAVKKGSGLGQKKLEPLMLNVIAGEIFTTKYKNDWPCFVYEPDDEDEDEDEDDDDGMEKVPSNLRGLEILKGAKRRTYFTSNVDALDANAKKAIQEYEKELLPLGFKHVADLGCSATGTLVVRSYAQENGTAWAVLMLAQFGRTVPEFFTYFARGASLTTTRNSMVRDELHREAYKTSAPRASVIELWKLHQARVTFLAEHHGAPKKVEPTAKGIASDVESFMASQEMSTARAEGLLKGDDGRMHYAIDAGKIHPDSQRVLSEADATIGKLGFKPVGDVTASFLSNLLLRGYAQPGGDTWALFQLDSSTVQPPAGRWEFVTYYEKGATLQSTKMAMSKDEPKRKIFRILNHTAGAEELFALHEKRKPELVAKWGKTLPVKANLKGVAEQSENLVRRLIG